VNSHHIAVIGAGYWGPNLIRCFSQSSRSSVSWICDRDEARLRTVRTRAPSARTTRDYKDILKDPEVELVAIATPVSTHYSIARDVLKAGKHVLVEKPLCGSVREASELLALARKKNLHVFVDHTFLFTGAVELMKDLVARNELGNILYFDSVRVNLGLFQHDINVLWDLAPHDLSIMDFLIKKRPVKVGAIGACHYHHKIENLGYLSVQFDDDTLAHFHLNWLSPIKIRRILIGGTKKMLVFDDMSADEKIKVYDKGVSSEKMSRSTMYKTLVQYRVGDAFIPTITQTQEALSKEVGHILDCLEGKAKSISDGEMGLRIVRILEAANKSLKKEGAFVRL
jgi:predicted dehydrogenase